MKCGEGWQMCPTEIMNYLSAIIGEIKISMLSMQTGTKLKEYAKGKKT